MAAFLEEAVCISPSGLGWIWTWTGPRPEPFLTSPDVAPACSPREQVGAEDVGALALFGARLEPGSCQAGRSLRWMTPGVWVLPLLGSPEPLAQLLLLSGREDPAHWAFLLGSHLLSSSTSSPVSRISQVPPAVVRAARLLLRG